MMTTEMSPSRKLWCHLDRSRLQWPRVWAPTVIDRGQEALDCRADRVSRCPGEDSDKQKRAPRRPQRQGPPSAGAAKRNRGISSSSESLVTRLSRYRSMVSSQMQWASHIKDTTVPRIRVGLPTLKEWDGCKLQGGGGEPGS